MKRRLATVVGIAALSLPSLASPAIAAGPVEPMINQRTCKVESTPQIVLVHSSGTITCYGGSVGTLNLGAVYVQSVHAGGYHGQIGWSNGSGGGAIVFEPGDVEVVGRTVNYLAIEPGN
jgi:hypothetical protein